jgi:erythromycin esterase
MTPATRARVAALAIVVLPTLVSAQPADSGFVTWARTKAVALGTGPRATAALIELTQTARVIGVGESVHNVRQFLDFRKEVLEQLVRAGGVTALVLESGLPEGRSIDDYVSSRVDSIDYGTAFTYGFGAFDEVRRAISWLREWNRGVEPARRVRVYGIDLPASAGSMLPAIDPVLAALGGIDSIESDRFRQTLRVGAARATGPHALRAVAQYQTLTRAEREMLALEVDRLLGAVATRRSALESAVGPVEADWVARLAQVAKQTETMLRLGAYHVDNPRDQAMAENILWVLGREPSGGKVLLWAHNAHVQRVPIAGPASPAKEPVPTIGTILRARLGAHFLAIGTSYGGPSLDSATVPNQDGVDAALGAVGGAPFLLPLDGAPRQGVVREWLDRPRPIRFQVGHLLVPLGRAFDAIVYFDRAEPAIARE